MPFHTKFKHGPIYMKGDLPEIPHTPKNVSHRLVTLEASGLTYRYPDSDSPLSSQQRGQERSDYIGILSLVLRHHKVEIVPFTDDLMPLIPFRGR